MIDFEKELKEFEFFQLDNDFINARHETAQSVQALNSTLKRVRKDQNDVAFKLEEALEILDEMKDDFLKNNKSKHSISNESAEKLELIKVFISVLDQFEDLYKFILNKTDITWKEQVGMVWNNISGILMSAGITRIENHNTIFNPKIDSVKAVVCNSGLQDGVVTEVIRSGYMYKDGILRKAEVIVNKNTLEGDAVE